MLAVAQIHDYVRPAGHGHCISPMFGQDRQRLRQRRGTEEIEFGQHEDASP
jgi:hypothetical protein